MKITKGIILGLMYILLLIVFIHVTSFIFVITTEHYAMLDTIEFFARNGAYTTTREMTIAAGQQFAILLTILACIAYVIYDQHQRRSK